MSDDSELAKLEEAARAEFAKMALLGWKIIRLDAVAYEAQLALALQKQEQGDELGASAHLTKASLLYYKHADTMQAVRIAHRAAQLDGKMDKDGNWL